MSQFSPKKDFCWYKSDIGVTTISEILDSLHELSEIGMILEVDVEYCLSLHDIQYDLPYLSKRIIPPGSKINKLTANLHLKLNYVIHYLSLKQALKARFVLKKLTSFLKN